MITGSECYCFVKQQRLLKSLGGAAVEFILPLQATVTESYVVA